MYSRYRIRYQIALILIFNFFFVFSLSAQTQIISDFSNSLLSGYSSGAGCQAFASADGSEVTLTQGGVQFCSGSMLVSNAPICANEYIISLEFNAAEPDSSSILYFGVIAERPEGYSAADIDGSLQAVPNRPYAFSLWGRTKYAIASNNDLSLPPLNDYVELTDFPIRGVGWIKMEIHVEGQSVRGTMNNGSDVMVMHTSTIVPGGVVYPFIEGLTGSSADYIRVRNLRVNVIEEQECDSLLGVSNAQIIVEANCGMFDDCLLNSDDLRACAASTLNSYDEQGELYPHINKEVLYNLEVARAYCEGSTSCPVPEPSDDSKIDKVSVCHKGKVIEISHSALNAHLKHGDRTGDCE